MGAILVPLRGLSPYNDARRGGLGEGFYAGGDVGGASQDDRGSPLYPEGGFFVVDADIRAIPLDHPRSVTRVTDRAGERC
jgi:hypothetical protein